MNRISLLILVACFLILGCGSNASQSSESQEIKIAFPLEIVPNTAPQLQIFDRKVEVAGIPTYAVADVADQKLLHAANVMAQYLDNDENGVVDNPQVVRKLQQNNAFMFMWQEEARQPQIFQAMEDALGAAARFGQDLGGGETLVDWTPNRNPGTFDASLEEVWHMITHSGFSQVYPATFGENKDSALAKAMDQARGGYFENVPAAYPPGAWYTYDDVTCEYDCMVTEYFYWAMTSILGAQVNRLPEIENEWTLNTEALVQNRDATIYQLLTDEQYQFPKVLPDGKYRE